MNANKSPKMVQVAFVPCTGEAHSPEAGGHIDNCSLCAPYWGRILLALELSEVGTIIDRRTVPRDRRMAFGEAFEVARGVRLNKAHKLALSKPFSVV